MQKNVQAARKRLIQNSQCAFTVLSHYTRLYTVTIPVTLTQDVSCTLESSRERTGLYCGSDCIFLHSNLTKKYIFPLRKMVVILKQHK